MIQKISVKMAANIILSLLSAVVVFHCLILAQLIPYQIVWGGRLDSVEKMKQFEITSILINVIILLIVSIKANYLRIKLPNNILQLFMWLLVLLFALNTLANLFATTLFEKLVFTPITLLLALLFYRLVQKDKEVKLE